MKPILLFVPCKDKNEAVRIGSTLLQQKVIACFNVVTAIDSGYVWNGKTIYEHESLLLAKTFEYKWSDIEKKIAKLHSYDTPDIMAIPIVYISGKYLSWMKSVIDN